MEKGTVKRRIFLSNALMVLVTLLIFLAINLVVVKIYAESVEKELKTSIEDLIGGSGTSNFSDSDNVKYQHEDGQELLGDLDDFLESWTIHRNEFILLFGADGIICILVLLLMSQIFTRNLEKHIMEPLDLLAQGADRIRHNDLTTEIRYVGDAEFEDVCITFNHMQEHILREQEKNRKYEKARTDMIAGISHDLRTPLTAIRGTIKGLMDGIAATPEMQEKFLQAAYRRTGDMDGLLNQLFYVSKIETGNMPLSVQKIEIGDFIRNYVKGKQELLDKEKEQMQAETGNIHLDINADPEQLQRIFDNLLENSRKYAERDVLKTELSLKRTGGGVEISFRDNGVGVPEEKLPYVFDEFYRGDESRNKKEGNGLGLYIVKYLVEAMGGNVRGENADGFVVRMELPAAETLVDVQKGEKMADNKKILIIEDDPDISMIEEAYLQASGFETKILSDGMDAAQIAEEEQFDLVLLDLMLPGKSGYQVCREIRDKVDIPILMVTARTESVDKVRGLGLGADDYISKPFDPAELVARVNANLRQYQRMVEKFSDKGPDASEEIQVQDLRILVNSWKVFKGDTEIRFPNREFELLKFLAMNPNIVFSREKLFEKIWGYDYVGDSATVMVHINRIREKIEDDPKNPKILETVWGAGYRLNK